MLNARGRAKYSFCAVIEKAYPVAAGDSAYNCPCFCGRKYLLGWAVAANWLGGVDERIGSSSPFDYCAFGVWWLFGVP